MTHDSSDRFSAARGEFAIHSARIKTRVIVDCFAVDQQALDDALRLRRRPPARSRLGLPARQINLETLLAGARKHRWLRLRRPCSPLNGVVAFLSRRSLTFTLA
jgi:hypothetical protein